jgi:cation diffusion facilitator CzcD-associated flavoprotein CzcO
LVVANGHHWQAKQPDYPGTFDGEMLHSHDVKSRAQLKDKRVLVVGAGNSAVDILSDAALDGKAAVHSMRRSYYFFPKMLFGKPTDAVIDRLSHLPLPRRFMYALYKLGMRILVGAHRHYGLEAPDHNLFEAHPTACTTYLDHIVHGRIVAKPGIERFEGKRVYFVDDTFEDVDMVIWATGYSIQFPFMDDSYILDEQGRSKLFIYTFDREHDDFFVCGLFEPAEGGVWQVADYQARLMAAFVVACETDKKRADWFRKLKAHANPDIGHGIKYQDTPWHKFEIQHLRFRRYMARLLKKFGPCAGEEQEMRIMGESAEDEQEKIKLAS